MCSVELIDLALIEALHGRPGRGRWRGCAAARPPATVSPLIAAVAGDHRRLVRFLRLCR